MEQPGLCLCFTIGVITAVYQTAASPADVSGTYVSGTNVFILSKHLTHYSCSRKQLLPLTNSCFLSETYVLSYNRNRWFWATARSFVCFNAWLILLFVVVVTVITLLTMDRAIHIKMK